MQRRSDGKLQDSALELKRVVPGLKVYGRRNPTGSTKITTSPSRRRTQNTTQAPHRVSAPSPLRLTLKESFVKVGRESTQHCLICASKLTGSNKGHGLSSLLGRSKVKSQGAEDWTWFDVKILEALDVIFDFTRKSEELGIILNVETHSLCFKCISPLAQLYSLFVAFVEGVEGPSVMNRILELNKPLNNFHASRVSTVLLDVDKGDNGLERCCSPPPSYQQPDSYEDFGDNDANTEMDREWSESENETDPVPVSKRKVVEPETTSLPAETGNVATATCRLRKNIVVPAIRLNESAQEIQRVLPSQVLLKTSVPRFKFIPPKTRKPRIDLRPTNISHLLYKFLGSNDQTHKIRCPTCKYFFTGFNQLYHHYLKCHPAEKKHIALLASELIGIKKHTALKKPKLPEPPKSDSEMSGVCSVCGFTTASGSFMRRHERYHLSTCFSCTLCRYGYTTKKELNRHKRNVHNEIAPVKEEKQKRIRVKKTRIPKELIKIKVNVPRRKVSKYVSCPVCPKVFNHPKRLDKHLDTKHRPRVLVRKKRVCTECGKVFASNSGYWNHTKSHRREFQCEDCPYIASNARLLYKHKFNHAQKTHVCPHPGCGRTFRTVVYLKWHSVKHTRKRSDVLSPG